MIVGHILPDLGTAVVGSSSLRSHHAVLLDFGHIEIAEFDDARLGHEQVCALDVTVANAQVVEGLEAADNLDEVVPDHLFAEERTLFLLFVDELQDVTAVGALHHDAEAVGAVFEEGFFVANHVGVVHRREDAHFV